MRTLQRLPDRVRASAGQVLAYDIETIAPQMADASFPPWPLHQTVAIGFAAAVCRGGDWTFDVEALVVAGDIGEADLIRAADRRMAAADVVTGYSRADVVQPLGGAAMAVAAADAAGRPAGSGQDPPRAAAWRAVRLW